MPANELIYVLLTFVLAVLGAHGANQAVKVSLSYSSDVMTLIAFTLILVCFMSCVGFIYCLYLLATIGVI